MQTSNVRHVLQARSNHARWAAMPPVSDTAKRAARAILTDVQALMATTRSSIACIQIDLTSRRVGRTILWHRDNDGSYAPTDAQTIGYTNLVSEIRSGLAQAAREIAARWPDTARPDVIGFATDGHMLFFNPGHPTCDGLAWLDDHLAARSPGAIVVDDGDEGLISILTSNRGMQ